MKTELEAESAADELLRAVGFLHESGGSWTWSSGSVPLACLLIVDNPRFMQWRQ
jgi:hypothetical protein